VLGWLNRLKNLRSQNIGNSNLLSSLQNQNAKISFSNTTGCANIVIRVESIKYTLNDEMQKILKSLVENPPIINIATVKNEHVPVICQSKEIKSGFFTITIFYCVRDQKIEEITNEITTKLTMEIMSICKINSGDEEILIGLIKTLKEIIDAKIR
jgi:hypothetical protein